MQAKFHHSSKLMLCAVIRDIFNVTKIFVIYNMSEISNFIDTSKHSVYMEHAGKQWQ